MFLSVFDMFKIGIGPSSSHTMGPMIAARRFAEAHLDDFPSRRVRASLFGSLAFTGKGHASDRAIILGLAGLLPESLDPGEAARVLARAADVRRLPTPRGTERIFDAETDVVFEFGRRLPGHANGMRFEALDPDGVLIAAEAFYSIGGGFVLSEAEMAADPKGEPRRNDRVLFPFTTAAEMLAMGRDSGLSISEIKRRNELVFLGDDELSAGLARIWSVMSDCVDRGLRAEGPLPGGLSLRRRARPLAATPAGQLALASGPLDRVTAYAIAVNEENAAGGRVVTAPTNGAAGIVPAVLGHTLDQRPDNTRDTVARFPLAATAIGGIIKCNASVSGAECGCQAEVGAASAMAAAGLAEVMGGTVEQAENAAEIALEHHLGMTCDPVKGLVQAPCIERKAIGSVKAITAASLALRGDGTHFMSLDACIEAMRQTGLDMHEKYKETSLGGLAVNLPNC